MYCPNLQEASHGAREYAGITVWPASDDAPLELWRAGRPHRAKEPLLVSPGDGVPLVVAWRASGERTLHLCYRQSYRYITMLPDGLAMAVDAVSRDHVVLSWHAAPDDLLQVTAFNDGRWHQPQIIEQ